MSTPTSTSNEPAAPSRAELFGILGAVLVASAIAIWWTASHAAFLLYGDAEGHIHIARRLFDSHRPGITQLGSVWLPLPHLLLVPFVAVDGWWRSGFAPVIPSAACYVLACLGLYRIASNWLSPAASSLALAIFAANPNLLYLQTTAMTEPLFLCELVWVVLLLMEWYRTIDAPLTAKAIHRSDRVLWAVIAVLIAAVYTRYDGWILAFLAWLGMALCMARRGLLFKRSFIAASFVLLLAPVGWMVYNQVVFADWLDFMRGPYSARAIELRTASSNTDPHPGWHNPWVSLLYFLKAAEMDAAALGWGEVLFAIALGGTAWAWFKRRWSSVSSRNRAAADAKHWAVGWTLLFWLPLPFYAYSVSYGSVPIFLPVWKPYSWYNTRYGMELLPAFALFGGFGLEWALNLLRKRRPQFVTLAIATLFVALAANVGAMLQEPPLTYEEGVKNAQARNYYNRVLSKALRQLHEQDPHGVVLMDTSTFPSVVPLSGLTYRQTINESDKEFYWAALGAPAAHADMVLAFAGDDIDKAVHAHPEHLRKYMSFHSPQKGWDQADATLYVTDTFPTTASQPTATDTPSQ
jgi:hypothetical protein